MTKRMLFLFGIVAMGVAIYTQTAYAQEASPDIIVMKSGEEIEAVIQEISVDSVRYTRASNPGGPAYTIPKSEVFMIRYANGERDVFADNKRPLLGGFGGSSTGNYKRHRFGLNIGIGGVKSIWSGESLTTFDFGGSYTYMFRSNSGLTFQLRPFFGKYEKGSVTQEDNGFQVMAGLQYIFPVIYKTAGGVQINPYASGKIGFGYLSFDHRVKSETGSSPYKTTTTTKTSGEGSGFCMELELGAEMNSHLYIAAVYNLQAGNLDGKKSTTVKMEDYPGNTVSMNTPITVGESFFGIRVGYQF
jgi:hypothetical protein